VVDYFVVSDLVSNSSPSGDAPTDQMTTNLLGYKARERPDAAHDASPIAHVRADAPPFLMLHGDADPMVSPAQSQSFHEALTKAGARSELIIVPGAIHEDAAFWTEDTLSQVRAFLDSTMRRR